MRWGILGSGKIASDFATALQSHVPDAQLQAVASRRTGPSDEFAAKFSIPLAFSGTDAYRDLAASDEVDVCYIATLNPSHKADAIACLEAGKHVVVEKPMALSLDDAKEMIDVARRNDRFLMEGMWTRFFPAVRAARRLIADGEIGSVVHVQADFGFMCDDPPTSRMFDKALGGGGLLDIGCYTIDSAAWAFTSTKDRSSQASGKAPRNVTATGVLCETGVDVSGNIIVDYEGGSAGLLYTLSAQTEEQTTIWGTHGSIKLHSPAHCPSNLTFQQWSTPSRAEESEPTTIHHPLPAVDEEAGECYNYPNQQGFSYQIQAVEDLLMNRQPGECECPEYTHAEMLTNAATIEAARLQMGYTFAHEEAEATVGTDGAVLAPSRRRSRNAKG